MQGPQAGQQQTDYSRARRIPANHCNLRHTNEEFIIDLGMSAADPTTTKVDIDTSVVISPYTAKKLWMSLGAIVANWEQHFGEIETEVENRIIAGRPTPLGEPRDQGPPPVFDPSIQRPPPTQFRGAMPPGAGTQPLPPRGEPELPDAIRIALGAQPTTIESEPAGSPCIPADFDGDGT